MVVLVSTGARPTLAGRLFTGGGTSVRNEDCLKRDRGTGQGTLSCFVEAVAAHRPTGIGRSPPNTKACQMPPPTNFFDPITSASPATTRPGSVAKFRPLVQR